MPVDQREDLALGTAHGRGPLGFTALKEWLRHRHPMIALDRVTDHEPGRFLTALVAVSGGLDVMAGHFPERAVYPGSQMIQAFAQCGIILFQMSTSRLADDEMTVVSSVEARFFRAVVPGDQLALHVTLERLVQDSCFLRGRATVDGTRVGAIRLTLKRTPVADLGVSLW
jgi:3-hydroxyacyl-[acyl-carrier-protein] dehydratase